MEFENLEQEGEEDQGSDGKTAWRKTCGSKVFNQGMQRRGWSGEERFAPATLTRSGIKPEEEVKYIVIHCTIKRKSWLSEDSYPHFHLSYHKLQVQVK